jgi:peptidoglycan/LPS O-acetylase OafA/YrhL
MNSIDGRAESLRPLTSLRFVAAMMIVLYHARNYFFWPWLSYIPDAAVFGVSFFFVLSGFILTHVYSSKPFPGYWRFIGLRIGRLWPVHIFATAIVVAASFSQGAIIRLDSIVFDQPNFMFNRWTELGLVTTLMHSLSPFMSHIYAWNSVSWSISTEFFFYLVFPWLLVDIGRTWHWKLVAAAAIPIALTLALHSFGIPDATSDPFSASVHEIINKNALGRLFEFCLGMSAWVLWDRYLRSLRAGVVAWTIAEVSVLLVALLWCLYGYWKVRASLPTPLEPWFAPSGPAWAFLLVIVTLASGGGLIGRALSTPPLVLLGEISFSIYMLHGILMKIYFTHDLVDQPSIIFFGPLMAASTAAFFLIESPARNFVARLVRRSGTAPTSQTRYSAA